MPFQTSRPSYLQHLLSSVAGLPAILGTVDRISALAVPRDTGTARETLRDLVATLNRLAETQKTLEADGLGWLPTYLPDNHEIVHFPNITAANLITYLWAFQLVCILYIKRLTTLYPRLPEEMSYSLDAVTIDAQEEECICLILRSVEFLMMEEFRLYGAASVILPLTVASDALNSRQERHKEESLLLYWQNRVESFVSGKGYHFVVRKV